MSHKWCEIKTNRLSSRLKRPLPASPISTPFPEMAALLHVIFSRLENRERTVLNNHQPTNHQIAIKMASSIVLTTLSVFLGLYFVFVGLLKVTPYLNRDMHREHRRVFVQFAKVVPFVAALGLKINPKPYRLFVGWTEIVAGLFMAVIPGRIKQVANVILLLTTLLSIHAHVALEEKFEKIAPSIVFSLMLCCRLVVNWQVNKKEAASISKPAAKSSTSETKRKKKED